MPQTKPHKSTATAPIEFFSNPKLPQIDSSVLINLFRLFSYAAVVKFVNACNHTNPLVFKQDGNHFTFGTDPYIDPDKGLNKVGNITWTAYQSILDKLLNGLLGNITQIDTCYLPYTKRIWSAAPCKVTLVLESNNTQVAVANFLDRFNQLVQNDTAFQNASECQGNEKSYVVLGMSLLFGFMAIGMLSLFLARKYQQRQGYSEVPESGVEITPSSNHPV